MMREFLRKGLLSIVIVPMAFSIAYALSPEDLPVSGGEIVIGADDELVIDYGETVELNGAIRVTGSGALRPQLTVVNNGRFTIVNGAFQAENGVITLKNNTSGTISAQNLALIAANNDSEIRILNRGSVQVTGGLLINADGAAVSFESSGPVDIYQWNSTATASGRIRFCSTGNHLTIKDILLQASNRGSSQLFSLDGDVYIENFSIDVAQAICAICFPSGESYVENLQLQDSGSGKVAFEIQNGADLTIHNSNMQVYGSEFQLVNDGSFTATNTYFKSQMDSPAGLVLLNRNSMSITNVIFVANGAEGQLGIINESQLAISNVNMDSNYGGLNYLCNRSGIMGIGNFYADISGWSHGQPSRLVFYNNDIFALDGLFNIAIVNTTGPDTVIDAFTLDQGVAYTFQVDSDVILNQDNAYCNAGALTDACALGQELWPTPCMAELTDSHMSVPALDGVGALVLSLMILGVGLWGLSRRDIDAHR